MLGRKLLPPQSTSSLLGGRALWIGPFARLSLEKEKSWERLTQKPRSAAPQNGQLLVTETVSQKGPEPKAGAERQCEKQEE